MDQVQQNMEGLKTSDYDFMLPEELIAQDPLADRSSSRLLVMDKQTGETAHHTFREIADFLRPGDCLVLNNTRVIPARLYGVKADTGAAIEVLLLSRRETDLFPVHGYLGRNTGQSGRNAAAALYYA